MRFMVLDWQIELDRARASLAAFVNAPAERLVFVPSSTVGVAIALNSIELAAGDDIITTDHAYRACMNQLKRLAAARGATITVVEIPLPFDPEALIDAVARAITPRTRLALFDHITSATALRLPLESLVGLFTARDIPVVVDGAHAPGQIPLDITAIGATWYIGNCHKWMCTPKGAAFLHVRKDRQAEVHPLVISHGANSPRTDRGRFRLEFDFTGTQDPTAWLVIPEALRFMGSLLPGGWEGVRAHNRALVLRGRTILCETLGIEAPAPESMIGSLATVPLPPGLAPSPEGITGALFERYHIEVPTWFWPAAPARILRVSAQVYNDESQYTRLAAALTEVLAG